MTHAVPRPTWTGRSGLSIDGAKAAELVGMAELLGQVIPLPEVDESNSPMAWLMWDLAVAARDARSAA